MSRFTFILRSLLMPLVIGGIVCLSAGRWDLPFVWAVLAKMFLFFIALGMLGDAGLIRERQSPGGENVDRLTQPLSLVLMIAHWVVVGLDVGRFHWSEVHWGVQLAGVIGYGAAISLNYWAVRVNRFYSSVVRVQKDRGQTVIDSGPYSIVRHPGYVATLTAMFTGGIALGSWLAMIPVVGFAALFLRRTCLEDNLLRRELPGYEDYASRVRYRLIPGVF